MSAEIYAGHLLKWTNYIKGYQKRWFVLQNGILSYYRNQQEVAHTCRGSINLANAYIHSEDSQTFVISNGSTQFYLKAISDAERKDWVTVLEIARNNAIKAQESDEDGDDISDSSRRTDEIQSSIASLRTKLDDLRTCHDLIVRQSASMVRTMQDLEQIAMTASSSSTPNSGTPETAPPSMEQIVSCLRTLLQSTTMFRITSQAMVNAAGSYRDLAETSGRRWQRLLQAENEQRQRLEEMVQDLARQQQSLENEAKQIQLGDGPQGHARDRRQKASNLSASNANSAGTSAQKALPRGGSAAMLTPSSPSTASINTALDNSTVRATRESAPDDEFFDAEEQLPDEYSVVLPTQIAVKRSSSAGADELVSTESNRTDTAGSGCVIRVTDDESDEESVSAVSQVHQVKVVPSEKKVARMRSQQYQAPQLPKSSKKRRTAVPEKPNSSLSLWSIMKNCIGKDLSKIPLPVNFNEPLSMLQRLCEEFEYSECLDLAAKCTDPCEQLAYLAAFSVSSYASTSNRTSKPFNPLLGETYEFDRRDDYGWRYVAEQVSHHPPMAACHCESPSKWEFWQEISFQSKFRGKYLVVVPAGITHIKFADGNHYTFSKVTTTVHNIIVGKLWVEHHGEMDIVNHTTRDTCHLKYNSWSLFNASQARQVTGVITDAKGQARYVLRGKWDDRMEGAKVERIRHGSSMSGNSDPDQVLETGEYKILWQRRQPPANSAKMYNFTQLAVELNEIEEGVAPTDSRRRPDQRFMEEGQWDEANRQKEMLENKQRSARRQREIEAENLAAQGRQYPEYQPAWFRKQMDPHSGKIIHFFNEDYWECKDKQEWNRCPEIY